MTAPTLSIETDTVQSNWDTLRKTVSNRCSNWFEVGEVLNKVITMINEEGYPLDDILDFVKDYGHKAFMAGHYETWAELTENSYSMEAIEAFVEEFGIENIGSFEDAYCGEYEDGARFAEELVEGGCYLNMDNIPDFVMIDWEATWRNLSDDYVEVDGHIFNNHF